MIAPSNPENESARLNNLVNYQILDTIPETDFDDITSLASEICNTPISLISLIDKNRQWFKSNKGLPISESQREVAFCAHAINRPNEIMIVTDARTDLRFIDNPFVIGDPKIVFYAGAPLVSPEGFTLGTLCVIDTMPRILSQFQLNALRTLSNQIINQFSIRKKNHELLLAQIRLEKINEELSRFTQVVAHDLKSPLHAIGSSLEILKNKNNISEKNINDLLEIAGKRCVSMGQLINGLLQYSNNAGMQLEFDLINFDDLFQSIFPMIEIPEKFVLTHTCEIRRFYSDEVMLKQVLINLITNAIKYNSKTEGRIDVEIQENNNGIQIEVSDNGPGIPKEKRETVFEIFKTIGQTDRFGNKGNGIGLATVKRIITNLNGEIYIDDNYTCGTKIIIHLPDIVFEKSNKIDLVKPNHNEMKNT